MNLNKKEFIDTFLSFERFAISQTERVIEEINLIRVLHCKYITIVKDLNEEKDQTSTTSQSEDQRELFETTDIRTQDDKSWASSTIYLPPPLAFFSIPSMASS